MEIKKVPIRPENLRIESKLRKALYGPDPEQLEVSIYLVGVPKVDRVESVECWVLGPKQTKLVKRLEAAMKSGKLFKPFVTLCRDCNGKTYYNSELAVFTHRRMNAALREIGF